MSDQTGVELKPPSEISKAAKISIPARETAGKLGETEKDVLQLIVQSMDQDKTLEAIAEKKQPWRHEELPDGGLSLIKEEAEIPEEIAIVYNTPFGGSKSPIAALRKLEKVLSQGLTGPKETSRRSDEGGLWTRTNMAYDKFKPSRLEGLPSRSEAIYAWSDSEIKDTSQYLAVHIDSTKVLIGPQLQMASETGDISPESAKKYWANMMSLSEYQQKRATGLTSEQIWGKGIVLETLLPEDSILRIDCPKKLRDKLNSSEAIAYKEMMADGVDEKSAESAVKAVTTIEEELRLKGEPLEYNVSPSEKTIKIRVAEGEKIPQEMKERLEKEQLQRRIDILEFADRYREELDAMKQESPTISPAELLEKYKDILFLFEEGELGRGQDIRQLFLEDSETVPECVDFVKRELEQSVELAKRVIKHYGGLATAKEKLTEIPEGRLRFDQEFDETFELKMHGYNIETKRSLYQDTEGDDISLEVSKEVKPLRKIGRGEKRFEYDVGSKVLSYKF